MMVPIDRVILLATGVMAWSAVSKINGGVVGIFCVALVRDVRVPKMLKTGLTFSHPLIKQSEKVSPVRDFTI
jgi:hypothetical protein